MARKMRCRGPMDVWVGGNAETNATHIELFAGLEVDLDRVINDKTGYTLGDAVKGYEGLFEPIGADVNPRHDDEVLDRWTGGGFVSEDTQKTE